MSQRIVSQIKQRLSLRNPQLESLNILAELSEALDLNNDVNLASELKKVVDKYPTCTDFERNFVSMCFALATGVGKTRLMGAFISYLYLAHGVRNFFVLAPNKTIYKKLIEDFGNPSHPKYVFKGIAEFATIPPKIITGDNYANVNNNTEFFEAPIRINVFNIQKISAESKSGKDPKIKRLSEYLGESYFEHLSGLEDLVILMDESHHYRADRGMTVINELKPILGLELTATPQVEVGGRTVKFKNVVYEYSLRNAMEDGFVKEPFVATRSNFDPTQHSQEEIDQIKLEDGIKIHEQTKAALEVFARNNGKEVVKPFVLVVAKDTNHASQIRSVIESNAFFGGYYAGKVIEVHSNQRGEEKDENIEQLLQVEDPVNKTEIVVHVNMLKEGWDVTNLYTIIPLRASASATLTEQTIGRGLRLPYGTRVNDSEADRLTIVSHDKYQAIIEEANKPDSLVKRGNIITIDQIPDIETPKIVVSSGAKGFDDISQLKKELSIVSDPTERRAKSQYLAVTEAIQEEIQKAASEHVSVKGLGESETKNRIVQNVKSKIEGDQSELFENENISQMINDAVEQKIEAVQKHVIEIPRLAVYPSSDTIVTINDFDLDTSNINLQPQSHDIYLQSLQDTESERQTISNSTVNFKEDVLENVIVTLLIDVDFIDYDQNAKLLYKLSGQAINHFRSYLKSEDEVTNVVYSHKRRIADVISSQIRHNLVKKPVSYDLSQTLPFTEIFPHAYEQIKNDQTYHFTETITPTNAIPSKIFTGFKKACHEKYKFDSKSEKDFATILEKDDSNFVNKWLRPSRRQFNITWGAIGSIYEPDFIVETAECIYMVEVKKAQDVDSDDVQEKARAANAYCETASEYTKEHGGKPWQYVVIPHDRINLNSSVKDLLGAINK